MVIVSGAVEHAQEFHPGMIKKEAETEEIDRQINTFAAVYTVSKYLREYVEGSRMNLRERMEFEDKLGYKPENYIYGKLTLLYTRSLNGHGNDMQAINYLEYEDVIFDHEFTRTADMHLHETILATSNTIELHDDNVYFVLKNLKITPKKQDTSDITPGYYNVKIRMTGDVEKLAAVEKSAHIKLLEVEKQRADVTRLG
jgi:hypothetical protein